MLGLTHDEIAAIRTVIARHPEIHRAVIFGSRAKGTHKNNSDVDICVEGHVDALMAAALAAELEEIPSPYRFDVVAYSTISSDALREHIDRVGVEVFTDSE